MSYLPVKICIENGQTYLIQKKDDVSDLYYVEYEENCFYGDCSFINLILLHCLNNGLSFSVSNEIGISVSYSKNNFNNELAENTFKHINNMLKLFK